MLRILGTGTLVALCLAAAPMLRAVEPGTGDWDNASRSSTQAVKRASRLSRDAGFTSELGREAERAVSASRETGRDGTPSRHHLSVPETDGEGLAKARKDLEALLAHPRPALPQAASSEDNDPNPLVFVSFSMPEDSLRALVVEVARTGSPLVLRGLVDGSLRRTAARLGALLEMKNAREAAAGSTPSLAIDPTLFERFAVDKVPAFVLPEAAVAPCTPQGCPVPAHLKLAGDVSLAYALGVMAREAGGTTLGERAGRWQQRLEARP